MSGIANKSAMRVRNVSISKERISPTDVMCCNCSPAKAYKNVPGKRPIIVVHKKVYDETLVRPRSTLTRKNGTNGKIRKIIM